MFKRRLEAQIRDDLQSQPAVALLGPRQVGKTTLALAIAEAGLPDRCVNHGLRKAAARLVAEAGCTANEIAAITGHRTLVEVSRYTKAADQVHLAQTAIDRLTARQSAQAVPTPVQRVGNNPEKSNEINVDLFNWRSRQVETANSYVIEIPM